MVEPVEQRVALVGPKKCPEYLSLWREREPSRYVLGPVVVVEPVEQRVALVVAEGEVARVSPTLERAKLGPVVVVEPVEQRVALVVAEGEVARVSPTLEGEVY